MTIVVPSGEYHAQHLIDMINGFKWGCTNVSATTQNITYYYHTFVHHYRPLVEEMIRRNYRINCLRLNCSVKPDRRETKYPGTPVLCARMSRSVVFSVSSSVYKTNSSPRIVCSGVSQLKLKRTGILYINAKST